VKSDYEPIIEYVFPRWRDRLGSAKAARDELEAMLRDPETQSAKHKVDAKGKEIPGTASFVEAETNSWFWRGRLKLVPDPDGGDYHLMIEYSEPAVDYWDEPGWRWKFHVRRRLDVERHERSFPAIMTLAPSEEKAKPGPKPDFDWEKIEVKFKELMDYHGDFTPDDPKWIQARLEEELLNFCEDTFGCEPGASTLRKRLPEWLSTWRKKKIGEA
jgi:hypothetical protein